MMGKGSVNHNNRTFTAKNVDKERSKYNVQFCHTDLRAVYHQLFDEALERYNAKQKRNDRKIDNYYEKIRRGKQEKLFHEVIFQIGNKDDMNARGSEGELAKQILSEFMKRFQDRNPNLRVFAAHLHMDEETPHLHIDFVPFIRNSKQGLDTRVTLKGALKEQGFKGGTRSSTEWNQWIESEKQELSKVMERYGVQWKQLGTHNKHLSVLDFEKQERQKEVAELALTNDLLKDDNQELKRQQVKLQREIEKMADSKAVIEQNIHAYDEDEKWQLPPPGVWMSAGSYRENKALPLVKRLKQVIKNLIIKCVNLMQEMNRLTDKIMRQDTQINRLTDRAMEQKETIKKLQGKVADLERVERYIGKEKVQTIIGQVKEIEQLEKASKRSDRSRGLSR